MSELSLPPVVELDDATKKAVIGGIKLVLARLLQNGAIPKETVYKDLIANPKALEGFINAFIATREKCDDLVKPAAGNDPVRDDNAPLKCGVSLNQIQQLMVRTCAKKVCQPVKELRVVNELVTKKLFFGLLKRSVQMEVEREVPDVAGERRLRELLNYLGFAWQLPLLSSYMKLTFQQIAEVGADLLALRTAQGVEILGGFDPTILRKVKQTTGSDFVSVLLDRPQAIAGIAVWNADMYEFFRTMLEDKAWAFFAREMSFFNVVAELDKPTGRIFGDVLCYIASENLQELLRLNIDKIEVLVAGMKSAFGAELENILSRPSFTKDILRKVVDNLAHTNQDKEKMMVSIGLSCRAMVPNVAEWMAKQPK